MKKIFITMIALLISTTSFANHGPAGCGLGAIMFEGKKGLGFNILAATFNGSSANQSFGMSTGTLGCEDAKDATVSAVSFIEANQVAFSNDIARGEGETLNAYLMLIKKENTDAQKLKTNFDHIFSTNVPKEIHTKITTLL